VNADFASAVKDIVKHPRCKGVTIWPTAEGRFMATIMLDSRSNCLVQIDANPMAALYKAMLEFERRI
jgi:hypothetical protein